MAKINPRSITFTFKFIGSLLLLAAMFVVAMAFGAADIAVRDVWAALTSSESSQSINIIREMRLPREIAAIVVGAALAVAGAIMQGITRNPLADPGLLGLTSGANAALAVTIAFGAGGMFSTMIACFVGSAVGAGLVFGIGALKKGGFSPVRLVLAGSAVSAFLLALSQWIGIHYKISKFVSSWTAGGMVGTSWSQLQIIVPIVAIGILVAIILSRQLTILSLNEEVALGLGQNIAKIKMVLFLVIILLSGAAVALVGNLVFVGLMIPHLVRAFAGTDYRYILPLAAVIGATFMLLADTVGRTLNAPYETPVVAIVAIIGLPFFLYVARKGGKAFA
ncbi:FecCD family ABC transporter permease [Paenibacillus aurantiacus]|uniref:FecCD family ABC transporter permease n=1 Tax=Paenibacillus aurantiacus TaxID=1936118 RepID=A0ABV5KLW8_9BACL